MEQLSDSSNLRKVQEKPSSSRDGSEELPRAFGRLTLLRRLARGGMGEVYLAATRGIEGAERPCVVKTIRSEHVTDKSFRARFLDETRIQAQLAHPGVAQILEADTTEEDMPYAVVEYVEGRHLGEVLGRSNQLGVGIGWADAIAVGVCFGDALAHVHERTDAGGRPLEIAHRDLCPQNVMLGYAGDLKLIDFGTARGENRRCRTVSGIVYAKPGYVAPEVANQIPGGPQADVYAFGVMVWELIAGHRFLQGDVVEHQAKVASGDMPLPPLADEMGAPKRLDAVLAKMTAPNPEERYETARQAVTDLVSLLKNSPSLADGDRSVRGRIAHMMQRLYPAEPARSRADFARRVALARSEKKAPSTAPGIPEPSPAPAPAEDKLEGILPGTRYRLVRAIARGTMGEVWEALHLDLGRTVALKVIPEGASRSPDARQRFRSEARAVARLDHPGVVNIHDFGITSDGRFYYVMTLLEGETLEARIERGALPWKEAVKITLDAAAALSAAHRAGILHRDISPSNIFLTADGGVRLLDFGVARVVGAADDEKSEAPVVVGTPEYVSPEQAAGAPADVRSDLYGLGVVLYEALTGTVPHPLGPGGSPTLPALLTAQITQPPMPPSLKAPAQQIPLQLDRILARALERDSARRYGSAEEFMGPLGAVLSRSQRGGIKLAPAYLSAAAALFAVLFVFGVLAVRGPSSKAQVEATAAEAPRVIDLDSLVEAEEAKQAALGAPEAGPAEQVDEAQDEAAPAAQSPSTEVVDGMAAEVAEVLELHARGRHIHAHHMMKRLGDRAADSASVQQGLVTTARSVRAWGEALAAAQRWAELSPNAESRIAVARLERATLQGDPIATLQGVVTDYPADEEAKRLLESYGGGKVASR